MAVTVTQTATEPVQGRANALDNSYMPGLPKQGPNTVVKVIASPEEKAAGRFNDANIKLLLAGMHRDGVVVLEDLVDPAHLDKINAFMVEDTNEELKKGDSLHRNFGVENIQQGPPLFPAEYFYDDVYLNGLLFHAATLYLGANPAWNLISGNNALPHGLKRQPAHSDAMCNHPPCPFYAIGNIYTVDTGPYNGSTEIWPGTHLFNGEAQTPPGPKGETRILDSFVEERKKTIPGFQPTIKKGSVLFRDMRTWHAGIPNPSDSPRYMIALGFHASWWHGKSRFRVPKGTGTYERILHGTRTHGIVPMIEEVSLEEYNTLRDAHDFNDAEKKSWDTETY